MNRPTHSFTTLRVWKQILKMRMAKSYGSIVGNSEKDCDRRFLDTYTMCKQEIHSLLWKAIDLKARVNTNQNLGDLLADKRVILSTIQHNTKSSLCTTVIMSAIETLGARGRSMLPLDWEKEKFKHDIGRFYSLFCDAVIAQGHHHSSVCYLAQGASVPVLNASSHLFRPFHAIGTLITLQENFQKLKGLTVAWIGPPDAVLNSFIYVLPKVGINLRYNCAYGPDELISPIVYPIGKEFCLNNQTTIVECLTPEEAIKGSDVIVTTSHSQRKQRITMKMLLNANENWIFIQDLPRSENEVCRSVFTHQRSLVWQTQKNVFYSVMAALLTVLKEYHPLIAQPTFDG